MALLFCVKILKIISHATRQYGKVLQLKKALKKEQRWVRCFFPPSPWCLRVKRKLRFLRLLSVLYIRLCPEAVHLGAADTTSSNVDNIYDHFRVTADVWPSFAFVWDTCLPWLPEYRTRKTTYFHLMHISHIHITQHYYTANDSAWTGPLSNM